MVMATEVGECNSSVDFAIICLYLNVFPGVKGAGEPGGGRYRRQER